MLSEFDGGVIDLRYRVQNKALTLEYALHGDPVFKPCVTNKPYAGFHASGYVGVSAGNPVMQNVNEIDVHRIDFFNLNADYYQHDAKTIVEEQNYYKRDEHGFVGKTVYPFSAKLNTIELGKVAFDILELKRNQREFREEQF